MRERRLIYGQHSNHKKDSIEIRIIRNKCISAATCVVYAPNTFDLDKDSIAIVKDGEWGPLGKDYCRRPILPRVGNRNL